METPPPDTLEELGHRLTETLHQVGALCAPLFDAAEGIRNELDRRGWSPTVSEELAAEYLTLCLRRLFADLATP